MNSILTFKCDKTIASFKEYMASSNDIYHSIYTSFGSKQNEIFINASSSNLPRRPSNAPFQMIPSFMRLLPDNTQGLVIVIDDLHDEESLLQNKSILTELSKQSHTWLDIIIIDTYLTKDILYSITQIITEFANSIHIQPNNYKLCNFIRFRQPNSTEHALEMWIPDFTQRILDSLYDGKYNHSYYQWFGYSYYTSDYMYCYKTYNIACTFYTNTIYNILQNALVTSLLNQYNIDDVQYYVNMRDKRLRSIWEQFQKNSITFVF